MSARPQSVLQIGCGSFGPTHFEAWRRLGLRRSLWVADPDPEARARAAAGAIPAERIVADYREVLGQADVEDIVAATDRHVELCLTARGRQGRVRREAAHARRRRRAALGRGGRARKKCAYLDFVRTS
jgi:predicted dehydrogenase